MDEDGDGPGELAALVQDLLDTQFAQFDMRGPRFDAGPGMPADAVAEIAAYRRAIFSVARRLWLDSNPGRSRVTPGTFDRFDLRLVAIGEGSAKPVFHLHADLALDDETKLEWAPMFRDARDEVTKTVRSFGTRGRPSPNFPRDCLQDVVQLGATLADGEKVVMGAPGPGHRGATLTRGFGATVKAYRKRRAEEGPRAIQVIGSITEYNSRTKSFQLDPSTSGPVILCKLGVYDPELARMARDFCSLDGVVGADVAVSGHTDDDGVVRTIDGVDEIAEVKSVWQKKVDERMLVLRGLADGWHGPSSHAPSPQALAALETLGAATLVTGHALRIGATPGGAIAIEWTTADAEYTAEIERDMTLQLFIDHFEADEVEEYVSSFEPENLLTFLSEGVIP